ncbi:unnamed protein product [Arabis nemorensis]|uniref:Uncharacterized protein n=1 Tax=Arabis nemorensis TaxID=586526 RepID=A0A565CQY3_9BRAS|nr:unnamed protein product [Arabis nemorensis]
MSPSKEKRWLVRDPRLCDRDATARRLVMARARWTNKHAPSSVFEIRCCMIVTRRQGDA